MAPTIQSAGQLAEVATRDPFGNPRYPSTASLSLYNFHRLSYAQILRHQPNVRTVVSFIARNVAQLGVHLFERVTDTDRRRVHDHDFARAIRRPNPADPHLTTYRLMHRTVWDVAALDRAFWVILPLRPLPRPLVLPLPAGRVEVLGSLWPTGYRYHGTTDVWELPRENVVYFQGSANIDDPLSGTSPIETLRRVIAEDDAAGRAREQFWRSGARVSGVVERPATAPDWSEPARDRFMADLRAAYTGEGEHAGGVPILEDGMTWKETGSVDARSAQYVEARKLSREEAAALWHIDPIWVGLNEGGAAFASVKERHKSLYQDTLGPWLSMLDQDLTFQALPAFEEDPEALDRLYVKLNAAEKMRGSTEDLADAIFKLTGRPILTANEGRALVERNDLPDGDGLALPLNLTIIGGDTETEPPALPAGQASRPALRRGTKAGLTTGEHDALRTEHVALHRQVLSRTFSRQLRAVLAAGVADASTIADVWDADRWDAELETDLLGAAVELVTGYAPAVGAALSFPEPDTDTMLPYLAESSRIAAENINTTTADQLAEAIFELDEDEDPIEAARHVFEVATDARAPEAAATRYTALAGFVAQDVATQAGRSSKVWVVTASNSRHSALDGETVPIGQPFSNGMAWPGDPAGGVAETAGCQCLLVFE